MDIHTFHCLKYLGIFVCKLVRGMACQRYAKGLVYLFDLFYILTNNLVCLMDKDKVIDKLMLTF
ncbi:hypothetical protein BR499_07300 [Salmonella enterica subsp. enterica serovar Uganda]|uniref:Uncharacterized protein n=1 Tax=Salmonella enterica subsp. enterica serovar Weslaco TaxID=1243597 RepID=A0A5X3P1H9_SALET|nr:hypothetical protein [Salmonella enterica]EAW1961673.1 hypothetical protein [Salmonella enterica subsp. enterica]EBZ6052530.1 hypothetical protein [Salmonella enterica subsp. enterica serovar Weslaco]ECS6014991.1 hypothetical protein [Salmonella enterica subsp. enterica serovar Rough O:k:1,5]EAA8875489.1 hypothetical protein [Salmonella enterica]